MSAKGRQPCAGRSEPAGAPGAPPALRGQSPVPLCWFRHVGPQWGAPQAGFLEQVRPLGLTLLRFPGSTAANTYDWRRAAGTAAQPRVHRAQRSAPSLSTGRAARQGGSTYGSRYVPPRYSPGRSSAHTCPPRPTGRPRADAPGPAPSPSATVVRSTDYGSSLVSLRTDGTARSIL